MVTLVGCEINPLGEKNIPGFIANLKPDIRHFLDIRRPDLHCRVRACHCEERTS